ncbi:MAG TPA: hypothetical protein VF384_13680 [Planctomycetota bacterium]
MSTLWDPDGAGPAPPRLVVAAGPPVIFGGQVYQGAGVAVQDPVTGEWSLLGGAVGRVFGLASGPNGELVLGMDSAPVQLWNGTSWVALGTAPYFGAVPGTVYAFAFLPNGDLIAGGLFTVIGGVSASSIARWNGTAWSPFGLGIAGGVNALMVMPNGDLIAGGNFSFPGSCIARWDGNSWSPLGPGMWSSYSATWVAALATMPNGDIVAAGNFTVAGSSIVDCVARWNGTTWSAVGNPTVWGGNVKSLALEAGGTLLAGGYFQDGVVKRWNGSTWTLLPGLAFPGSAASITLLPSGDVIATGVQGVGCATFSGIARWNGNAWVSVGRGIQGVPGLPGSSIDALAALPGGDLVVGGAFTAIDNLCASNIARRTGTTWGPLGTGTDGPVRVMTVLANGDLLAAGSFSTAGGVAVNKVARWNGTAWSTLGAGLAGNVTCIGQQANGEILVGEDFPSGGRISRWDGTTWYYHFLNGTVNSLAILANGDLVAGGSFTIAGGTSANCIARFDGSSWMPMHLGFAHATSGATVISLLVRGNGELVAGGTFTASGATSVQSIARWNGSTWSPLGSGLPQGVCALAELPGGDLLASSLTSGTYRWNGANWSLVGSGRMRSLLALANGNVVAGGTLGTYSQAALATFTATCPATAVSFGAGCLGSGGLNELTATTLPWTGTVFRSVATGMPANGLALGLVGFATSSIPLSSILPQGVPGCTLLVSPDLLELHVPSTGSVSTQLALPNTVVLAGQIFHQQVVPLELGAPGITALTSTNALTLTIGSF